MSTTPTPSTPSDFSTSSNSSNSNDRFPATEWTQQSLMSDTTQQKGLLLGLGALLFAIFLFSRRSAAPEAKAARRLVRDMRHVDDAGDVRDLLGSNLPTIIRPVLLLALGEAERQVQRGFDKLEHEIERL
jgi:hypothetical protein